MRYDFIRNKVRQHPFHKFMHETGRRCVASICNRYASCAASQISAMLSNKYNLRLRLEAACLAAGQSDHHHHYQPSASTSAYHRQSASHETPASASSIRADLLRHHMLATCQANLLSTRAVNPRNEGPVRETMVPSPRHVRGHVRMHPTGPS